MFSRRLHWDLAPNPISILISDLKSAGREIIDLTESNPTHAGLEYPVGAITQALANPRILSYDPDPAGLLSAREAVSAHLNGLTPPDRLILTTSTSEAYGYVFKLLTDPGDQLLVPRPSYPLFEFLAGMELLETVPYESFEDLPVSDRTRAVLLVNPNNPTGRYLHGEELGPLVQTCQAHNLAIISDEVFSEYPLRPDGARVATMQTNAAVLTFCLGGLSKCAGLPQMKLGWIAVNGPEPLRSQALERLELISDTYLSAGTPVQVAAAALLEAGRSVRDQISARTLLNLATLRSSLPRGYSMQEPEGGWYAILDGPDATSEEELVLDLLKNQATLVQPGFFFDFSSEPHLVLSLLTEPAKFAEGLRRIAKMENPE